MAVLNKQELSFDELLLKLQEFWQKQGCSILQPYDISAGAGTFHPATFIKSLDSKPLATAYVAPSRRRLMGDMGKILIVLEAIINFKFLLSLLLKIFKKFI